ncbi:MAG: pyridoxamine 5'-phosphate oxidase family protein [Mycobacterium sp.]|nr:pyridoxamine 5'-phosphate oxidase family protein [Mycobacterium sp.]
MAPRQDLEVLDREQCLELLQTVPVGRLVFTEQALPAVQPVNFRLWDGDVVVRVAGGGKLAAAVGNLVVAFQADELDVNLRRGWSVTAVGRAELITDDAELAELSKVLPQPWVNGERDYILRIRTEKVTGRRLGPAPDDQQQS